MHSGRCFFGFFAKPEEYKEIEEVHRTQNKDDAAEFQT
jgi:hypothetical protein